MTQETISEKQVICILILFILGSNLVTGGSMEAGQDSWLSIILSAILSIPIIIIFSEFKKIAPNKDLFDLSYEVFGNIGGAIITLSFTIYTIRLGGSVIRNFTEFIQVVSLPETPQYINAICFGLISLYTIKKGIEILARGATFVMPVVVLSSIFLSLLAIRNMNIDYIRPVFAQEPKDIFIGALYNLMYPFAETALFIIIFPMVDTKRDPKKVFLTGVMAGATIFLIVFLRNLLIMGAPMMKSLYFPTYAAVGLINIEDFVTRIEVFVSGNFVISGLVKITVCLFASCKGIARLFNIKDYKSVATPITLLMIATSAFVYQSTMNMVESINNRKFYILFFQVGIPLIVFIGAKFKMRKSSDNNT